MSVELPVLAWLFFELFAGLLAVLYLLRRIYALHNKVRLSPCLDELWLVMLGTAIVVFAGVLWAPLQGFLLVVLAVLISWMWFDAIMLYLYGFEINWNNVKTFFQGAEAFSGDSRELVEGILKRSWFLFVPLTGWLLLLAVALQLAGGRFIASLAWGGSIACFVAAATKSRFRLVTLLPLVLVAIVLGWGLSQLPAIPLSQWLSLLAIVLVAGLKLAASLLSGYFFTARSSLRGFVLGVRLKPSKGLDIEPEDTRRFVDLPVSAPAPSDAFGCCRNASVILITVESLSREYVQPYREDGAYLPFMQSLADKGLVSECHYACSPNTNQAVNHLYQGNYPCTGQYPFLPLLKAHGYSTTVAMTTPTRFFRLRELLDKVGFDKVFDTDNLEVPDERGDYAIIDKVDAINEALGDGPFFLHLENEQTHTPYQVVDSAQFCQHEGDSREVRFKNAAEESDWVYRQFITELGKRRDLSDVLIIYTGDHGQSFGEFGYVSHSSASINAQVRVPFVLSHPALGKGRLKRSTHFDVLPTIIDLLGIECQQPMFGRSLMQGDNDRPLLLYSDARKGNAPANSSLLDGDDKYMVDLVYGYRYWLDQEDRLLRKLSSAESRYYETLLYRTLEKRGLISHSAFAPRQKTKG